MKKAMEGDRWTMYKQAQASRLCACTPGQGVIGEVEVRCGGESLVSKR